MKPVKVTVTAPQSRAAVFDFIDVLGAYERFTEHFLLNWETSGPRSGIGARARMRVKKPGPPDGLDMEVIAAESPRTTVEESVSAKGRRRTRGTYILDELPGGGSRIRFELTWRGSGVGAARGAAHALVVKRNNQRSLRRLAVQLSARPQTEGGNR